MLGQAFVPPQNPPAGVEEAFVQQQNLARVNRQGIDAQQLYALHPRHHHAHLQKAARHRWLAYAV